MAKGDYSTYGTHDLLMELNPGNEEVCAAIDPHLAQKLVDTESLAEVFYYLCYGDAHKVLPATRDKINQILDEHLSNGETVEWWRFEAYKNWLLTPLKLKLIDEWLNDDDFTSIWVIDIAPQDTSKAVDILTKLTKVYKKKRSTRNIEAIKELFSSLPEDKLDEACKVVSKSTPAISVCLLSREDVNEKYTLKGLRALSKLSKQRSVAAKVDFGMLGHLGPKARLDAMKQLLGMMDKYSRSRINEENPFKEVPTREEVETFLFPCSLKYNEQVAELVKEFDKLVTK